MATPSINITFDKAALKIGETANVTFTFSAAPTGFTASDVSAMSGAFSGFTSTSDPLVYKGVFTPTQGISGVGGVSVVGGSYADIEGHPGLGAPSPAIAIDTAVPTVSISSSHATVHADETANITFTFSEAPVDFDLGDVSVTGGALGVLLPTGNPLVYTTSFTPTAGVASGSATISITNGSYTDAAGNSGVGGASPPLSIQTVRPAATITVADTALKIGETSLVTVTFSEAVSGFASADLTVANGTVSNLRSDDGGVTWTATLAPTAAVADASNVITLDMTGVTNASGNTGAGSRDSNNYAIDTAPPTATIAVANPAMQAGQTSLVTISFSEAVSGFDVSDLSVANGVIAGLVSSDGGVTWTATLAPTLGVSDPTNLVLLDTAAVADVAGNPGASIAISNNYAVGYVPPTPVTDDDVISLPAGGGSVSAGAGEDSVAGAGGGDVIQGNAGDDTLSGGGGDDVVRGGQDNDFVHGNVGGDLLFGDVGNDSVFGGQGEDFVQGGAGGDVVAGDLGRDTVLGGQGADTVFGGAGDDYVSGDLGDDVLMGGAGADLFNFGGGGARDVVMDFSHAEGDRIRISPTDAADFAALSARIVADGGNAVIELGSQTIVLAGVAKSALSAADFVFG